MKPAILICVFVIYFLSACSVTSKTAKQGPLSGTWVVSEIEGDVNRNGGGEDIVNSCFTFQKDSVIVVPPIDDQGNTDEAATTPYLVEDNKLFLGKEVNPLIISFEYHMLVLETLDGRSRIYLQPIKDK